MRLIMVRHGEPDYQRDCLTPLGRAQASAAAERLSREGISEIYSSPNGRAKETASFTADRLGLPFTVLDYMHEITWGGPDLPEDGHPWLLSWRMIEREDFDFSSVSWRDHPFFRGNEALACYDRVAASIDGFLGDHGFSHQGSRFLCTRESTRTLVLFSHGGSGACVLSHVLSLPFPWVCAYMPYDFTSILVLDFPSRPGEFVFPRLALFNATAHLPSPSSAPRLQQQSISFS